MRNILKSLEKLFNFYIRCFLEIQKLIFTVLHFHLLLTYMLNDFIHHLFESIQFVQTAVLWCIQCHFNYGCDAFHACHNSVNYVCYWHWFVWNFPCLRLSSVCVVFSSDNWSQYRLPTIRRVTVRWSSLDRMEFVMKR